ncbi:hypothetical protein AB0958_35120 [Streptomyces sp. NPDC006655]|uniref:hypothetical protein n=1 Tax=Streptomyces sp. NPDC006655 TaxID=3156898 RepID=UPI0034527A2D
MRQLKRGQVWTDHVAELCPGAALCALLNTSGERRESLVTVRVTTPLRGVVLAPHGDVPGEQMERVDVALRAVLSL